MIENSVFVIDDDEPVRESLIGLLRANGVRARAFASGARFFEALPEVESACVITDVRMPGMDGVEVVRRLADTHGRAWPVVVITGHAEVPSAVQMMKAGVVDYIEKPFDPTRLLEVVQGCFAHLDEVRDRRAAAGQTAARLATLTPREHEVFRALVDGRTNKEIAGALEISPRTVEIFRAKVMRKMEARSLSHLIRMALTAEAGAAAP